MKEKEIRSSSRYIFDFLCVASSRKAFFCKLNSPLQSIYAAVGVFVGLAVVGFRVRVGAAVVDVGAAVVGLADFVGFCVFVGFTVVGLAVVGLRVFGVGAGVEAAVGAGVGGPTGPHTILK